MEASSDAEANARTEGRNGARLKNLLNSFSSRSHSAAAEARIASSLVSPAALAAADSDAFRTVYECGMQWIDILWFVKSKLCIVRSQSERIGRKQSQVSKAGVRWNDIDMPLHTIMLHAEVLILRSISQRFDEFPQVGPFLVLMAVGNCTSGKIPPRSPPLDTRRSSRGQRYWNGVTPIISASMNFNFK